MSFNVGRDKPLVLRLTLPENDNTRFVRAFVRDDDGVQLAGSPFTLANLGDGRYVFKDEDNLKFPTDAIEVSAVYKIYDDAGFTIPTVDYGHQYEDVFRLSEDASTLVGDQLEELSRTVQKALRLEPDLEAEIEYDDDTLEAEIDESDDLEAEIDLEN